MSFTHFIKPWNLYGLKHREITVTVIQIEEILKIKINVLCYGRDWQKMNKEQLKVQMTTTAVVTNEASDSQDWDFCFASSNC